MALSVRDLDKLIGHKVDSTDGLALSTVQIVNEAGRLLVSLAPWTFQLRPSATLALVSGQNYLTLPPDFGRVAGPPTTHPSATRARTLQFTTFQSVLEMRGTLNPGSNIDGTYVGAIIAVPNVDTNGGPPTFRIDVWPNVTSSDPSAFVLAYYANWAERTSDTQLVNIPEYAEGLMRHLVREVAAGYENDDQASVWDRVGSILQSDVYKAAMLADRSMQSNLGPIQGGAAALVANVRQSGVRTSPFPPVPFP